MPFDVHVETVAGNEIGAEKALSVEGEPVDRGERAADAAADLLQRGRRKARGQRVKPFAVDPLHECEGQAEIRVGVAAGEHGWNRHARADEGEQRDLLRSLLLVPLPIAQQDRTGAVRAGQFEPEIGVGETAERLLHRDEPAVREGAPHERFDAGAARLKDRLRPAPFVTQRSRPARQ